MPPRRGGVSPRPKIVIDWRVWYRDCDGVGTYQRAPPHLPKWPRRLTRAFSIQLHLTLVMFSAASFQGSSPLGTTCAHVYELPMKDNRNFMSRVLYSDIY